MREDYNNCLSRPVLPASFYPIPKIKEYVNLGIVRSYAKGSAVVLPGESTRRMIYVISGKIRVNMVTGDGREKLIYSEGAHSLLGRLFKTNINDFHIVAQTECTVCFFTQEDLKEIFRQDEDLIFEVLKNYTAKVSYFMQHIRDMDFYTPSVRIMRLLLELCRKQGKLVGNTYEIKIDLSQKNIAEITGAHYVTVSKVLGCLKKQGIAYKAKDTIYIYDLDKLEKLIDESCEE